MKPKRTAGLLSRVRAFGQARGIEDEATFLQKRVQLFVGVCFLLLAIAWARWILFLALLGDPGKIATQPTNLALPLVVMALGLLWLYLKRKQHARAFVYALEAPTLVLLSCVFALLLHSDPGHEQPLAIGGTHAVSISLLIRAVVVPSSARRTFVVSLCAIVPLMVSSLFAPADAFASWGVGLRAFNYVNMWATMYALLAVFASWIIYGLQTRVRDALELGQYRLVEKLGEGGMGAVYRGEHRLLKRSTAIKLLHPERTGAEALKRFEREVRITAQLQHPNTVAIYDYGHTPDGVFYYAMEHLDGLDLQELVELDGPQPPGRVIHLLEQATFSLAEAHAAGLIHRDIKPSNLMLTRRGGVSDFLKVVDFGLVKDIGDGADAELSRTGGVIGTPLYMAPETATNPRDVDLRADLYALGAVGYYLVTGTHLFGGETMLQVLSAHLKDEPQRPSERLGRPVPEDLEQVLLTCLAKEPEARYRDAVDLREALRACKARGWSQRDATEWWDERAPAIGQLRADRKRPLSSDAEGLLTIARESVFPDTLPTANNAQ